MEKYFEPGPAQGKFHRFKQQLSKKKEKKKGRCCLNINTTTWSNQGDAKVRPGSVFLRRKKRNSTVGTHAWQRKQQDIHPKFDLFISDFLKFGRFFCTNFCHTFLKEFFVADFSNEFPFSLFPRRNEEKVNEANWPFPGGPRPGSGGLFSQTPQNVRKNRVFL